MVDLTGIEPATSSLHFQKLAQLSVDTSYLEIARILAAAHFLSDVSWGATIILALLNIANEVLIHIKPLHLPEEEPAPEVEQAQVICNVKCNTPR